MTDFFLGIDSGGTMTKVALFTADGMEVASETRATQMLFPSPGFVERDADAMWAANCDAIKRVLIQSDIEPERIMGISATGYGAGIYCIDDNGVPTRNGVVSTDTRAIDVIEDWSQRGLIPSAESDLCQSVWHAQNLALFKWLDQNEPTVVARTSRILECKDFNKFRLTGIADTDLSDAAVAGLLDLNTNTYALRTIRGLGLSHWIEKLPALVTPTTISGYVTDAAAFETGLMAGTPVVTGCIDIVACSLASGITRKDQISVVAGTWSINCVPREGPQKDPLPVLQMPYPIDDLTLACEASTTSASNLEWICNNILSADKVMASQDGKSIYDRCNEMVESRIASPSDVYFLPYLFGGPNDASASFLGMRVNDHKADLIYAVYEGIVFAHKRHLDQLIAANPDQKFSTIRLAGGAARSAVWAQMFADVMNMDVEIAEGSELGSLGASIVASVGVGKYPSILEAVQKMVNIGKRFTPEPQRLERYSERYAQFINYAQMIEGA